MLLFKCKKFTFLYIIRYIKMIKLRINNFQTKTPQSFLNYTYNSGIELDLTLDVVNTVQLNEVAESINSHNYMYLIDEKYAKLFNKYKDKLDYMIEQCFPEDIV